MGMLARFLGIESQITPDVAGRALDLYQDAHHNEQAAIFHRATDPQFSQECAQAAAQQRARALWLAPGYTIDELMQIWHDGGCP